MNLAKNTVRRSRIGNDEIERFKPLLKKITNIAWNIISDNANNYPYVNLKLGEKWRLKLYKVISDNIIRENICNLEKEDIYQEGLIEVWKGLRKYDGRCMSLNSYITQRIIYRLRELIVQHSRVTNKQLIDEEQDIVSNGSELLLYEMDGNKYNSLSMYEKYLLFMYIIQGRSGKEIHKMIFSKELDVNRRLKLILKKVLSIKN